MRNLLRALRHYWNGLLLTPTERRHSLVGPSKLWKMKREFQIKFLKNAGLKPQHVLLDIGCGTLRGGIPIIEYLENKHYFGIESRKDVLDEGRNELDELGFMHKEPNLVAEANILDVNLTEKFDYIWAFSVLIHMHDGVLCDTLDFVSSHLLDVGVFYANVNIGSGESGNWQGFPVVWRSLSFYEQTCLRYGLKIADIGSLKDCGHLSNNEAQDQQRMLKICKV